MGVLASPGWIWLKEFANRHSTIMTILSSAVIFYGGFKNFRESKRDGAARAWAIWGMVILGLYLTTLFYNGDWLGGGTRDAGLAI